MYKNYEPKKVTIDKRTEHSMWVIQTARTEEEINEGIARGYRPLIRDVIPSDEIKVVYALERDPKTGEYTLLKDASVQQDPKREMERVLDGECYYPYQFPMPFAAYLIPMDIEEGERVMLEDIIEDIPAERCGESTYRLECAEAVWNGSDFEIDLSTVNNVSKGE
jgi:hypothetical protein